MMGTSIWTIGISHSLSHSNQTKRVYLRATTLLILTWLSSKFSALSGFQPGTLVLVMLLCLLMFVVHHNLDRTDTCYTLKIRRHVGVLALRYFFSENILILVSTSIKLNLKHTSYLCLQYTSACPSGSPQLHKREPTYVCTISLKSYICREK